MSHALKFSGPFVKQMYASDSTTGRKTNNPVYSLSANYNEPVPAPNRRVNTIIQNQGATELTIGFTVNDSDEVLFGGAGLKVYAGQSVSLDNYNGPIYVSGGVATIIESFA